MSQTLTVQIEKPITSAEIVSGLLEGPGHGVAGEQIEIKSPIQAHDTTFQQGAFTQVFEALGTVVAKLDEFYQKLFVGHKEEIAKLSVEIARKVLMQKVENGDYEIESIVKEALSNAPTREDIVVHLNPDDHAQFQKAQDNGPDDVLAGIKFVSDSNIGRAECLLESPKGVIESLINQHLERVGRALQKAE